MISNLYGPEKWDWLHPCQNKLGPLQCFYVRGPEAHIKNVLLGCQFVLAWVQRISIFGSLDNRLVCWSPLMFMRSFSFVFPHLGVTFGKIWISKQHVNVSGHMVIFRYKPRSKCSAFPVHRSTYFRALQWYVSLRVHCTSLSSALHSPLKYIMFHTAMRRVLAAYALQRSCNALKYCTARHCQCTAGVLHFDLGKACRLWHNYGDFVRKTSRLSWYVMINHDLIPADSRDCEYLHHVLFRTFFSQVLVCYQMVSIYIKLSWLSTFLLDLAFLAT